MTNVRTAAARHVQRSLDALKKVRPAARDKDPVMEILDHIAGQSFVPSTASEIREATREAASDLGLSESDARAAERYYSKMRRSLR